MEDVGSWQNIKKIIFDLDGVITSERLYWNSSAMTVYEKMFDNLNVGWCEENVGLLSDEIFINDSTIVALKNLGVNSNIDLTYVVYLAAIIGQGEGVEESELWNFVNTYALELDVNAPELYDYVASEAKEIYNYDDNYIIRYGGLWREIEALFQHWYFGDEKYVEIYGEAAPGAAGKTGFINYETPIVDLEELRKLLKALKEKGYILGIATGRNDYEVAQPLNKWGIKEYFDDASIATYDTVVKGEKVINEGSLAKPNPYVFLKASYPDVEDKKILSKKNHDNRHILVVGDAGADIIAAQAANMTFAAVLTGVSGRDAYDYFAGMNSDIIMNNVLELKAMAED